MAPPFSRSFFVGVDPTQPLPPPDSLSLMATCHMLFLRQWRRSLNIIFIKLLQLYFFLELLLLNSPSTIYQFELHEV